MRPTDEFPDDPALPAIAIIRQGGLARALPTLHLGDQPIDLQLSGYTDGSPATFEVRAGDRHVAVKVYADDPSSEAELYRAMAAAGFAGDAGPRAPRLVAWERDLRILVLSWLDGEPVNRLIKSGRGRRAGELAAAFLWRLASLPIKLGPSLGPGDLLYQVGKSVAELGAADAAVGDAAKRAAKALKVTQPKNGHPRLVHGTLYARHILDLGRGDGPGVIDWQRYGQGPVEVDAGMFLATVTRLGLRHDGDARSLVDEAARIAEGSQPAVPVPLLGHSALELVLAALSATPATPAELDQIQALLDKKRQLR
jgi:aminoglycoside phosphotransferase (APT) family kinase protein